MVDGYRKKSDHADPVQLHAGDAASDVSGHLLAAVRESGTWRLDLYSGKQKKEETKKHISFNRHE